MATLADLTAGQFARVSHVEGTDATAMRLMEMGVIDGEQVRVMGSAPMGDPIEISVSGYRLSLRRLEAQRVHIEVVDSEPP